MAPKQVRERGNFAGLTLSLHWLLCLISLSPTEKEKKKKRKELYGTICNSDGSCEIRVKNMKQVLSQQCLKHS